MVIKLVPPEIKIVARTIAVLKIIPYIIQLHFMETLDKI